MIMKSVRRTEISSMTRSDSETYLGGSSVTRSTLLWIFRAIVKFYVSFVRCPAFWLLDFLLLPRRVIVSWLSIMSNCVCERRRRVVDNKVSKKSVGESLFHRKRQVFSFVFRRAVSGELLTETGKKFRHGSFWSMSRVFIRISIGCRRTVYRQALKWREMELLFSMLPLFVSGVTGVVFILIAVTCWSEQIADFGMRLSSLGCTKRSTPQSNLMLLITHCGRQNCRTLR